MIILYMCIAQGLYCRIFQQIILNNHECFGGVCSALSYFSLGSPNSFRFVSRLSCIVSSV